MAKDRIADTLEYLRGKVKTNELPGIATKEISEFASLHRGQHTHGDADLSLGWDRFHSRPGEANRHAIRAYIWASLLANKLKRTSIATEKNTVKWKSASWLHKRTASRMRHALGLDDPLNTKCVRFSLKTKGHGTSRASSSVTTLKYPVAQMMKAIGKKSHPAIVLIDMQSSGDVGQHRYYGNHTVLDHQQEVLKKAVELGWVIYDIVIDPKGAKKLGKLNKMNSSDVNKALKRQRRTSYAEKSSVKTMRVLWDCFSTGNIRHIPKPNHPTFEGTLFAKHLKKDGIDKAVVMGFDANQCVKATVFGVPEQIRNVRIDPPAKDLIRYIEKNNCSEQEARDAIAPPKVVKIPYTAGLLDRGIKVYTSRCILASGYAPLEQEWKSLSGHR